MRLKVEKINETARCNSCDVSNYLAKKENPIYNVKIGIMNNRLCKGCLVCLVGAIALEIDLHGE